MSLTHTLRTVNAVRCVNCHKLYLCDSTEFITIQGNISVGNCMGSIVQDNVNEDNKVVNSSVYCRPYNISLLANKPTPIDTDLD